MTAQQINGKALDNLSSQHWMNAQKLFFMNMKKHPSHQTYNNLGYYLISEGLICKNGKTRNALKHGMKYLFKASKMETSVINMCAIVKAIDYQLRTAKEDEKSPLYAYACSCLKKAISIECSNTLQYNYLRFSYLLEPHNENILLEIRNLVHKFTSVETVSLYLELLCDNFLIDEGLECIETYGDFLDEVDLLMFYAKFGLYEKGYVLCETICNVYNIDARIASAIIECCVNTFHLQEAKKYAEQIEEMEKEKQHINKENWCQYAFGNTESSTNYRKIKIAEYKYIPPVIDRCCYFGCNLHDIHWDFVIM